MTTNTLRDTVRRSKKRELDLMELVDVHLNSAVAREEEHARYLYTKVCALNLATSSS